MIRAAPCDRLTQCLSLALGVDGIRHDVGVPRPRTSLLALALPGLLTVGCTDGHDEGQSPSGATCPETSTLTWENFGEGFMTSYCNRCHSTTLTGAARQGAPSDHNFDTAEQVGQQIDHIDAAAAGGLDAVNTSMPIGSPVPTEDERRMLGEWLACGAP